MHTRASRRAAVVVSVALLFAGMAAMFLPPAGSLRSALPVGRSLVVTVPLFNVWTIWWNCDRLQHGLADYWQAPIFFPETDTFAFSEPQPATLIVAPVIWLSGSRILAYNVYLWLSLMLNGLLTCWLLRRLGHRLWLAVLGGTGMLLLPIVHAQFDVLQLVPLWGILWTWWALRRTGERPTILRGCELGLAIGVTFAMSIHHGMFLVILLTGPVWVLLKQWRTRRMWTAMLAAAAVTSLIVLPMAIPMRSALRAHEFERTLPRAAGLSARPADYLVLSGESLVRPPLAEGDGFRLSPGWAKYTLALAGVLAIVGRRRGRRWRLFLTLTAVLAFGLSLGPHLQIGTYQPWETIRDWCPGMAQVRSVFRFAYFYQMAVLLLAVEGGWLLWLMTRRRPRSRRWRLAVRGVVAAVCLLAALESWPRRPALAGVPSPQANREWITFVRQQTEPGRAIVCLPFSTGWGVSDFSETTRWMYLGTFHGVPLVNGYSGFFPASNDSLRELMQEGFFTTAALDRFAAAGAQLIVVRLPLIDEDEASEAVRSGRLTAVYEDDSGVVVYRLNETSDSARP